MTSSGQTRGADRLLRPLLRLLFTFGQQQKQQQQKQRTRLYETKLKTNKKLHTKLKIMFSSYILLLHNKTATIKLEKQGSIVKNMKTHLEKS